MAKTSINLYSNRVIQTELRKINDYGLYILIERRMLDVGCTAGE